MPGYGGGFADDSDKSYQRILMPELFDDKP